MKTLFSGRTLAGIATAFVIAAAPGAARAQEFINVLTGGTSGVYYPLGVALSKIYGEKVPNVRPTVQATKASVENLNLLQQGRGEIAFALGDSVKLAWEGNDNDHAAFYVNDFTVEAGEPATFKMESVVPDVDYDKVVLFVDLGRCTAGTTVTLTKICMQEHK